MTINRRLRLSGLFAVLMALMAQLAAGVGIPRLDPFTQGEVAQAICHAADEPGQPPAHGPAHSRDCLVCPLCVALHAAPVALPATEVAIPPPALSLARRPELPPPATAPPSSYRPPTQPRAPPTNA